MDPLSMEILRIIEKGNGAYSWYPIDRELSTWSQLREAFLPQADKLMELLRGLEQNGLITETSGHHISMPLYSLTARGRETLKSLGTEKPGVSQGDIPQSP